MFFLSFHEPWVSAVVASLVYVAVVASGASVLVSSVVAFSAGASAAGSTFWASTSVFTRSDGLAPGLYIDTLSLEWMLIPKLT